MKYGPPKDYFLKGFTRLNINLPLLLVQHNMLTMEQILQALEVPDDKPHRKLIRKMMLAEGWREVALSPMKIKTWCRLRSEYDDRLKDLLPWEDYKPS